MRLRSVWASATRAPQSTETTPATTATSANWRQLAGSSGIAIRTKP